MSIHLCTNQGIYTIILFLGESGRDGPFYKTAKEISGHFILMLHPLLYLMVVGYPMAPGGRGRREGEGEGGRGRGLLLFDRKC